MKKVAIIGGGITGISLARMLHEEFEVVVFEKEKKIGGLIRCDELREGLYHKLGGHVFNTKTPIVAEWFWRHFDRDEEFYELTRNAKILFGNNLIGYPIENHIYQLEDHEVNSVIKNLLETALLKPCKKAKNFKETLLNIFGTVLCEKYFFPYNQKIWRTDLGEIPTEWLEGKLPMPAILEILTSNILRKQETSMVHSKFFYPKMGGSQFVIDRLAQGVEVRLNAPIKKLERKSDGGWYLNHEMQERYDVIVNTSDIRALSIIFPEIALEKSYKHLKDLKTRGITNAFCECDHTDISWLYLPEPIYSSNRIIYTGSFSKKNNFTKRMTCVVEFNYGEDNAKIKKDINLLPGNLNLISKNDVKDAYVVQKKNTRKKISIISEWAENQSLYLAGRFAEWEYYNMDKCIEKSLKVAEKILRQNV